MTTLCYIEKDGCYLMLHRVSKKHDVNKDKWIGIGGHFEEDESPEECLLREAREETGLTLTSWQFRGLLTFISEGWDTEYICLYTADEFQGELTDCNEGHLQWIPRDQVLDLNLWEGDKIFFRLLNEGAPFFSMKLSYSGDRLKEVSLNGQPMELLDIRDESGAVTGQVRERTLVHRDGDLHGTVHIWAVREGKEGSFDLLIQKRDQKKESYPGCYDISAAGHVQAGDGYPESALRELQEELGIRAQASDLEFAGYHSSYSEDVFRGNVFRERELSAVYIYRKAVDTEKLVLQKGEVESVRWMALEECIQAAEDNRIPNCFHKDELEQVREYLRMNRSR